jgi:hypothetical protein
VLSAAYLVGVFLWIAVARCRYGFDLEWMEGGMVDHLERVVRGQALYVAPSVDFVTFLYNPFYYFAAVPFAWIFGVGYFPLRLLSLVSTLASVGLIFWIVWQATRARVPALVGAGFYAGTFALSGGWFDLARVDSLFVALCLGAYAMARTPRPAISLAASALCTVLAFETKQAAAMIIPGIALTFLLTKGLRSAVAYSLASLLPIAVVTWLLHRSTDGWYTYYAFSLPMGFPNVPEMYVDFWKQEVFAEVPVAMLFAVYFACAKGDRVTSEHRRAILPFVVALVGMGYVVRLHAGSYLNDKMALHAALALTLGFGTRELWRGDEDRSGLVSYGAIACLLQFAILLYPPARYIPTRADRAEGARLLQTLSEFPGPVLITQHGYLPRRVGKPSFAHGMATFDVQRTEGDPRGAWERLRQSYYDALASHRFSAVLTDDGLVVNDLVERFYRRDHLGGDHRAMVPKTGPTYRPRNLYVPR